MARKQNAAPRCPKFPPADRQPSFLLPWFYEDPMTDPERLRKIFTGGTEAEIEAAVIAEAERVLTPSPAAMKVWEAFCSLSFEDQERFAWMWWNGYEVTSGVMKRGEEQLQRLITEAVKNAPKPGKQISPKRLALGEQIYKYQIANPESWTWRKVVYKYLRKSDGMPERFTEATEAKAKRLRKAYCDKHGLPYPRESAEYKKFADWMRAGHPGVDVNTAPVTGRIFSPYKPKSRPKKARKKR
jgi:hypothetical protein